MAKSKLPDGWTLDRIRQVLGGEVSLRDVDQVEVRDERGVAVTVDCVLVHGEYAVVHQVGDDDEWSVGHHFGGRIEVFAGYGPLDAALRGL